MTTMRPYLQRIQLSWLGFWIVGALCGVLLVIGITALRHERPSPSPSLVFVTRSSEMAVLVGGRLGGLASSDTANDAAIRRALQAQTMVVVGGWLGGMASSDTATDWAIRQSLNTSRAPVIGGRLGGIASADTPTDAAFKRADDRITGPGEGLNRVTP